MKRLILLVALLAAGCGGKPVEQVNVVGAEISYAHFIDAHTGKCVKIYVYYAWDKSQAQLTLDTSSACQR